MNKPTQHALDLVDQAAHILEHEGDEILADYLFDAVKKKRLFANKNVSPLQELLCPRPIGEQNEII